MPYWLAVALTSHPFAKRRIGVARALIPAHAGRMASSTVGRLNPYTCTHFSLSLAVSALCFTIETDHCPVVVVCLSSPYARS